ncbi:MAG: hypothetical protein ACM3Y9_02540 [Ignavibacteria bacterium]
MDADLIWGITFTLAVIGVCGMWFYRCGHADKNRHIRRFAQRSLLYAGLGFLLGLAFLTSDLGSPPMGLIAFTACCGLLLYAAGWALVVSDDQSTVLVNLTGRALLLTGPQLAPFYTLPAPQEDPLNRLPPVFPRTCYIVSPALGRIGADAGRTDIFTVDAASATDLGDAGLLVRRLIPAVRLPEPVAGGV